MSRPAAMVPMAFVMSVPRSIKFYERLGFTLGNTHTPPGQSEPTWAWLESGRAQLMVARAGEPVVASQQAVLFYVYYPDVPETHREMQAKGIEVGEITYPFFSPRGEFRVTDPDGYCLIVAHT